MSLKYVSRLVVQGSAKAAQGMKDTSSSSACSSSRQMRRLTSAFESNAIKAATSEEKRRKAEESLRAVMYLSCWGPN